MTMLEPEAMDWTKLDDSTVYYAAADGIPQAVEEQRRRELVARTSPNQPRTPNDPQA